MTRRAACCGEKPRLVKKKNWIFLNGPWFFPQAITAHRGGVIRVSVPGLARSTGAGTPTSRQVRSDGRR